MQYVNMSKSSKVRSHFLTPNKPNDADKTPEEAEEKEIKDCKARIKGACINPPRSSACLLTLHAARMKIIWNSGAIFELTDTFVNNEHVVKLYAPCKSRPTLYTMSAEDRVTAYRAFAAFFADEKNIDALRATIGQRFNEDSEDLLQKYAVNEEHAQAEGRRTGAEEAGRKGCELRMGKAVGHRSRKGGLERGLQMDGGNDSKHSDADAASNVPDNEHSPTRTAETYETPKKSVEQKASAHGTNVAEDAGARGRELECGVGIDVTESGHCEREENAEDDDDDPLEWIRMMLRDMGVRDKGVREVPPPTPSEDMRDSWSDGYAIFGDSLRSEDIDGADLSDAKSEARIRDKAFIGERDSQVVESAMYCKGGTLSYSGVLPHARMLLPGAC